MVERINVVFIIRFGNRLNLVEIKILVRDFCSFEMLWRIVYVLNDIESCIFIECYGVLYMY